MPAHLAAIWLNIWGTSGRLLLEARRVLGKTSCFGADPAAELEGEARRCGVLTQWVRLHSCTLNNLGIAHRTPPVRTSNSCL